MKKIKISLEDLRNTINEFYDDSVWHFITLNGLALEDDKIEVQWIFSKYESSDDIVIYYAEIQPQDIVPSVVDIIPSAIISQRELVDMFGVDVEGSAKGLYLDEDSPQMPLSACGVKS